jgi:hypothetical protein
MAAPRPEHAHVSTRPAAATPTPRHESPAPTTTGWREDKCPVVSKRPLHSRAAAKMSPHIRIGPEPVLAAHAPSPPAAGSHCPAREDSAPHCGTEFFLCLACSVLIQLRITQVCDVHVPQHMFTFFNPWTSYNVHIAQQVTRHTGTHARLCLIADKVYILPETCPSCHCQSTPSDAPRPVDQPWMIKWYTWRARFSSY